MRTMVYHLTKERTQLVKGIAVLMMLVHHLWGFPARVPDLTLADWQIQIGEAGKMCVAIFLFLSGYGLTIINRNKTISYADITDKIKRTYLLSWKIFFIFIPIGLIMGGVKYPDVQSALANLLLVEYHSGNAEWWFLGTYMELLLLFPIVHRIKRYFWIFAILSGLSMRFLSGYTDEISNEILKSHIYFITYYYCAFIIGVTFARYSIFEWLCRELGNNRVAYFLFLLSIIGICFVIRIKIDFTFIIVPFFILLLTIWDWSKTFTLIGLFLGKHSMNLWLIHPFFCTSFLQPMLMKVSFYNSFLALILLILSSILSSIVINKFWKKIKTLLYNE